MPRYKEERTFLRPQHIRVSDYGARRVSARLVLQLQEDRAACWWSVTPEKLRRCAIGPQRGPDSAISHFLYRNIGTGP